MMKKTISKRVLALSAALVLILCSASVSAADDIADLKTEYIRDYTLLSPEDGVYTNDKLNYEIDNLFVRSLKGSSTTKDYSVGVGENGITAVAGYFLLKMDLGTNYTVSGVFSDDPNGKYPKNSNIVRLYFNSLYDPEKAVDVVYNPPIDLNNTFRFNIKSTSKLDTSGNPTEEDLGHTIELQYGSKTLCTDVTTDGTRFTMGGDTNFTLSYAGGAISLSIENQSTGFSYNFEKSADEIYSLLENSGITSVRTSGSFCLGDHQSMGGRIALKSLNIQNNNISIVGADAPFGKTAVFAKNSNTKISLALSKNVSFVKKAELFADGKKCADFNMEDCTIYANLPQLSDGRHILSAVITDLQGNTVTAESNYFYIGKGTFIGDGFTVDGNGVSDILAACGGTLTANFKYEYEKDALIIICLYDNNNCMKNIAFSHGNNGIASASVNVPENAFGYTAKAFMFESFENSAPISCVLEID